MRCHGLVLLKEPKGNIFADYPYLELEQEDSRQGLYKVVSRNGEDEMTLSRLFVDLNHLKEAGQSGTQPSVADFTYFEPSLHHAFVAMNQESGDQIVSKQE